jgi:hypothetical protein
VGVAGPYPAAGPPTLHGSDTFSCFEELESKSIDEHIKDYTE